MAGAIAIIIALAWVILVEYSACVVSKRKDEEAEEMREKDDE